MSSVIQSSGVKQKKLFPTEKIENKKRKLTSIEEETAELTSKEGFFTTPSPLGFISNRNLKELTIFHCTALDDEALFMLERGGLSLTSLNLEGCREYGSRGVASLINIIVQTASTLEQLNLRVSSEALNKSSLTQMVTSAKQLKELRLSYTTVSRETVVAFSCLKNLLILDISGCTFQDDDFCSLPEASFPSLTHLDAEGTAASNHFIAVISRCKRLESLVVTSCRGITDETLQELNSSSFPKLTDLEIR